MGTAITVIVLVLLVIAVVGVVMWQRRRRETAQLRERFGPEYDRAVGEHGNRRAAEHRLSDVATRRDEAEVRDLTAEERSRFGDRWTIVQAEFVDSPAGAAAKADVLVAEVMRTRGYPLDEVDDRGDLVAADHADLARHYRAAHTMTQRSHEASTEEMRQAFMHYRHLFAVLLGGDLGTDTGPDGDRRSMRVDDGRMDDGRMDDGRMDGSREDEAVDLTSHQRTSTPSRGRTEPPA